MLSNTKRAAPEHLSKGAILCQPLSPIEQFPGYHKYEMELAGRPLTLEVGKLAELANAAVMVGYGDTRVLVLRHRLRPSPGRHRFLPPERGL